MIPVVTPEEMAAIDRAAPEPVEVLIGRAGAAVAHESISMLGGTYGRRVVVVAGKGNNGADGRAAAERLRRRGVRVVEVDAAAAPANLPPADLVIDAAYGTGFRGEYHPPAPVPGTPVLAVDIPSGVDGLTGRAGGSPLRADRTVTFAALKPGLLLADGAELAGEVTVADIGLDVSSARTHVVEPADVARWLPTRPRETHKWRAAVWVIAGSPGMTGAAHLATRAAQRAGAGYVRLSTPGLEDDPGKPVEAVSVSLPAEGWAGAVLDDLERFGGIAIGPGLGTGTETASEVRRLVHHAHVPIVVDGDGLTALGRIAADVVSSREDGTVLTPHDGELARLGGDTDEPDRIGETRRVASAIGAVVLRKGPTTVVAAPDGKVLLATAGDARLATAGTGDVLTGLLGALVAQGVAPLEAAGAAAHLHGRAGALAWRRGMVAGDLVDRLPEALSELPED
ncbi:MAG: NAD(P)H-hydrate dehydratase [Acidimicrobiia bacterium]|nr:NAD(P)H-hydrate dehydratase [Acidimicrobiia bacterium]